MVLIFFIDLCQGLEQVFLVLALRFPLENGWVIFHIVSQVGHKGCITPVIYNKLWPFSAGERECIIKEIPVLFQAFPFICKD